MIESLAIKLGCRIGICGIYRIHNRHHHLRSDSASLILRQFSSSSIKKEASSFKISYLVNQCGISWSRAPALSKYVNLETLEQPNSVLEFFRDHNFSATQISKVVNQRPRVLLSNPTETLLPKVQFLRSLGFSSPEIAKAIAASPPILLASLENQLIPDLEFLTEHYQSHNEAVTAIKRTPRMLVSTIHRQAPPLFKTLRDAGTPERAISMFVRLYPATFRWYPEKFSRVVTEVIAMGIDPTKSIFIDAVFSLSCITKSSWENKLALYKKWGWSKEQALCAFSKWPQCFRTSEVKVMGIMDLFVNKLGWESSFLAKNPVVIAYSLQNRLLPRTFVLQFLDSEGLLPHDLASPQSSFFIISEEKFLAKYVHPYSQSSSLLEMYLEKKAGFPFSREK